MQYALIRTIHASAFAAILFALFISFGSSHAGFDEPSFKSIALYLDDRRRPMTDKDYLQYPGAGILFCYDDNGIAQRASASWLIGSRRLVLMNAHIFMNGKAEMTRSIDTCFFQIGGRNYAFSTDGFSTGVAKGDKRLHITDDWAVARLKEPVDSSTPPQPMPPLPELATGDLTLDVIMVSPAGQSTFRAQSSIETCQIREIDEPSEDGIRLARHNCNDGHGASGSGLFDMEGRLIGMHSASLDMERSQLPFDARLHYGSALLIEGDLYEALIKSAKELM